jgi:YjjG family noncanonical pyrimidine nucleotidase
MKKDNIKHVFFDLDHTLWDFEKNSALTFKHVFSNYNEFIDIYVPINAKYWKLYRDEQITQQELRYGRLREAFDVMKYTVDDELLYTLSAEYVNNLPRFNHLYEGAIEILEYLKPKYTLHIITNGFHEVQAGKLKNSNIEQYFATITNSEMAGCKKPNPVIFEYALKAANAEKFHSIMIGDCIEADVQGALNCGIDAIYFNEHRLEAHESILQINNLLELKTFL